MLLLHKYKEVINYPNHIRCHEDCKCVYLIKNLSNGLSKIGITNRPKSRLRELERNSGNKLMALLIITLQEDYDESAEYLENYLHNYFENKRKIGEWFDLTIRDVVQIRELFWFIEGEDLEDNVKEFLSKQQTPA